MEKETNTKFMNITKKSPGHDVIVPYSSTALRTPNFKCTSPCPNLNVAKLTLSSRPKYKHKKLSPHLLLCA